VFKPESTNPPRGAECRQRVPNRYGPWSHMCELKPFHQHNGEWFCKRHDPCKRHEGDPQ
jgi:hypothetical protein